MFVSDSTVKIQRVTCDYLSSAEVDLRVLQSRTQGRKSWLLLQRSSRRNPFILHVAIDFGTDGVGV